MAGENEQRDPRPKGLEKVEAFGRCEHPRCGQQLVRPDTTRCSVHRDPLPGQRHASKTRRAPVQAPLMAVVPPVADEPAPEQGFPYAPRQEAHTA
ncbi:hypothetical protein ACFVH9_08605 [Streptomyces hirsutus]|uniref:hypothetical protein n=1 Tax=Streptomyces hirsutus TaxID=35620 RepID=UPI00362A3AAF